MPQKLRAPNAYLHLMMMALTIPPCQTPPRRAKRISQPLLRPLA